MNPSTTNFSHSELRCKCGCGINFMNREFLTKIQELRDVYNEAMPVSSGYRCPTHNSKVSSTGINGPHVTGRAIDIRVYGHKAHKLLGIAMSLGFPGIGISQKGDKQYRFIHLDDLEPIGRPRPWIWTY